MRGGNDKFKSSAMTECSSSNMSLFFYFLAMCYLDLPSWIPILNFSFSWVEANLFIAIKMLAEFSIFITCPLKFFSIFLQWRQTYFIYRFRFFCFRYNLWICFMWIISKEFWISTYIFLLTFVGNWNRSLYFEFLSLNSISNVMFLHLIHFLIITHDEVYDFGKTIY